MSDTFNKERYDFIINCLDEKIKKLQINQEKQLNRIELLESVLRNLLDDIGCKFELISRLSYDAFEEIYESSFGKREAIENQKIHPDSENKK